MQSRRRTGDFLVFGTLQKHLATYTRLGSEFLASGAPQRDMRWFHGGKNASTSVATVWRNDAKTLVLSYVIHASV